MSTSSFIMQSFNHEELAYVVMERGKFLSTMPIFFDNMHSKGTCRQDKNSVKKYWHTTEDTFNHDHIGILMVKSHSKGTCRHAK